MMKPAVVFAAVLAIGSPRGSGGALAIIIRLQEYAAARTKSDRNAPIVEVNGRQSLR